MAALAKSALATALPVLELVPIAPAGRNVTHG
jgi:hypothetical protein